LKGSDSLQKSLVKAVLVTMENIAFEEPEVLSEAVDISGETISFSLQVVSPYLLFSPYLLLTVITMPRELAVRLTRTIYRDDEKEVTDSLLDDTVGEFLNTIIGTMMGDLTLGERIFEMGLPERTKGIREVSSGNIRKNFFRIEEFPFCIEIYGDAFIES